VEDKKMYQPGFEAKSAELVLSSMSGEEAVANQWVGRSQHQG
jgi:hypothetical protein